MKHRCAVCWDEQGSHDEWFTHAVETHEAVLAEFGFHRCLGKKDGDSCPGVLHALRLPNFGAPRHAKRVDLGRPLVARDGTIYTPIPLPLDAA